MEIIKRPDDMQRITTVELAEAFIAEQVDEIRKQVGDKKVLLALSGGVDSSVVAALLIKAIGKQLVCVHVNHGLMRKGESEQVVEVFGKLNFKEDEEPRIIVEKLTALPPAENLKSYVLSKQNTPEKEDKKSAVVRNGDEKLYLRLTSLEAYEYKKVKNLLELFRGNTKVVLYLTDSNKRLLAPSSLWIKYNDTLFSELCRILGEENVALK